MKTFFNEEKHVYLKILILIACTIFMFSFLWTNNDVGKLLFFILLFIVVITLFFGMVIGLVSCLGTIFIIGSIIFYLAFKNVNTGGFDDPFFTMQNFVVYGASLLICVLIAGFISEQVSKIVTERNKLRDDVRQYVAIDPDTMFDNIHRMEIEVQREINRTNRHGGKFTLLFIELDYYNEFLKTYGYQEFENLLKTIGQKVNNLLRSSDRKFRYSENKFAFLLTETSKEQVEFVIDKMAESLREHTLLNGKTVTLSFHISFDEYNEEKKDLPYLDFILGIERETIFYEM